MTWWWRNLSFSFSRARFSENLQHKCHQNCQCCCKKQIDNNFLWSVLWLTKTLQWNHSPGTLGSTWVLNNLASFLRSIRVQTMGNCSRFVNSIYQNSYSASRGSGIKHKKSSWGSAVINTVALIPKPRSQVSILRYRNWSIPNLLFTLPNLLFHSYCFQG